MEPTKYTLQWRRPGERWQETVVVGTSGEVAVRMTELEKAGHEVTCAIACEPFPSFGPVEPIMPLLIVDDAE